MVDLSRPQQGVLGPGCWFSDLYYSAFQGHFTGGILIQRASDREGQAPFALFFMNGDPVHAVGLGFMSHYLGQVTVEQGFLQESLVLEALQRQQAIPENDRPLFGDFLKTRLGLSEAQLEQALDQQCRARFAECFRLGEGSFTAAPGQDDRIKSIAHRVDGWRVLLSGLTENGADGELKEAADRLLGRAIRMKGSLQAIEALVRLPAEVEAGFKYLEKPRKPDQFERALGRRRARGMVRLLELLNLLELLPAAKAVPIPKASRVRVHRPESDPGPSEPAPAASSPSAAVPAQGGAGRGGPSRTATGTPNREQQELFQQVERLHKDMGDLDHFELLGVVRDDPPDVLRRRFTEMTKRFHPDTYRDAPEEVLGMAKEITARLAEANRTLADPEKRANYLTLLADKRILGDARRAELIRDAEVKVNMALVHLKKRNYEDARALLVPAVERDPDNKLYRAHLGWSMFADPNFDREKALGEGLPMLQEAVVADPDNATVHFYLGRVYKQTGNMERALTHFKRASKLDPKFTDAVREANLLARRRGKAQSDANERKGLARFFKGLGRHQRGMIQSSGWLGSLFARLRYRFDSRGRK